MIRLPMFAICIYRYLLKHLFFVQLLDEKNTKYITGISNKIIHARKKNANKVIYQRDHDEFDKKQK